MTSAPQPRASLSSAPDSGRERALLLGVQLLLLLPFLGRPVHIDDALWLQIARQIQTDPSAPLDFLFNWTGFSTSVHAEMKNPPGIAYYLAWLASWSDESERAMHAGMSLFAVAASQAVYSLARRVTKAPLYAGVLFAVCPAIWICATSLMVDVPVVALMLLAVLGMVRAGEAAADERSAAAASLGAGVAAAGALVSKYFAVSVVPLLAAHRYFGRRAKHGSDALIFGVPAAAFAAWWWVSDGHMLGAIGYRAGERASVLSWLATHGLATATFTGALLGFPIAAWAAALYSASDRGVALMAAAVALVAAIGFHAFYGFPFHVGNDALLVLSVAGTGWLVVAALRGAASLWSQEATPLQRTLLLWLAGGLVFASVFNWTVNVRTIALFAAPAVLVFAWRSEGQTALRAGALALTAAVGVVGVVADAEFAAFGPTEAARTQSEFASAERVRFIGHWGFQHYMEAAGYEHVDFAKPDPRPGDVIVIPQTHRIASAPLDGLPAFASSSVTERARRFPWVVMDAESGAGLHGSFLGPLPFAFAASDAPLERVEVARW